MRVWPPIDLSRSLPMASVLTLNVPGGDEEEPVNVMAIMSGVLSMAALAAEKNPPAGAALDAMSAIAGFIGENAQEESNIPSDLITEAGLQSMLDTVCTTSKDNILKVLEAVMGGEGFSEADIPHEMKMKEGEGLNYQHAISYLFGNGQWLQHSPTDGLKTLFKDSKIRMVSRSLSAILHIKRKKNTNRAIHHNSNAVSPGKSSKSNTTPSSSSTTPAPAPTPTKSATPTTATATA